MKALHSLWFIGLVVPMLVIGCQGAEPTEAKVYPIKGKVVAVDLQKPAVRLDHEDIPGLMKGMEMEFQVDNPKLLDGIGPGDLVQGDLMVRSNGYVITRLDKRK